MIVTYITVKISHDIKENGKDSGINIIIQYCQSYK